MATSQGRETWGVPVLHPNPLVCQKSRNYLKDPPATSSLREHRKKNQGL